MDAIIGLQFRFNALLSSNFIDWESVSDLLDDKHLLGQAQEVKLLTKKADPEPISLILAVEIIYNRVRTEALEGHLLPKERLLGLKIAERLSLFNRETELSNIINPVTKTDGDFSDASRAHLTRRINTIRKIFCTYAENEFLTTFKDPTLAKYSYSAHPNGAPAPITFYVVPSRLVLK
jgi:hypothetical protein